MAEIKISELSIGDWVMFTPNKKIYVAEPRFTSAPAKITGAYRGREVILEIGCKREFMAIPLSCIEPIPLTPEILEKNGFEELKDKSWVGHNHHCHIQQHRSSWTLLANKRGFYRTIRFEGLEFVHQLQHALRLAGVEKEIEL